MKAYHGCSISNLIKMVKRPENGLFVTDTAALAGRYANAQATGVVSAAFAPLTTGACIVTVEIPDATVFCHRSDNHASLDVCEAYVQEFRICSVVMNKFPYVNTIYGTRGNRMRFGEIVASLEQKGIAWTNL